ncbi:MAG: quinolinate synthase NadA [Polyangiaceae bacterium]|nr:quinolinate synthase NadA [Polyangiaceae bacterium]
MTADLATLDLDAEILRLKQERNAVLLAHYYQDGELQDLADFVGDSLQLAQAAKRTEAEVILFAGVYFMAETAKIVNPDRVVVVPDLDAGCSLADGCPADRFRTWRARHPDAVAVSYINCSAAVKAESDIICTSSNAVRVVESIPRDRQVLFAPDRNLGRYVAQRTRRDLLLWPGSCVVHERFSLQRLTALEHQHPKAKVIAHPECEAPILERADFIGSTAALLDYVASSSAEAFVVLTESGILHEMRKRAPAKTLIPGPPNGHCACSECEYMRLNTPEKVYLALRDLAPTVELDQVLQERARVPMERMLALG